MPKPRHLKSAPIHEAIFDIRVKARSEFQVEEFEELKETLSEKFPLSQERYSKNITWKISSSEVDPPEVKDLGLQGLFFRSQDEKTLAQFRIDGFTLNKLNPYSSWAELFPIMLELWAEYDSIAKPELVTRIATRFINRIPIVEDGLDFDDYLMAAPKIPPDLPQTLSSFSSKVTIDDTDHSIAAHVSQSFAPNPSGEGIIITLDIDAFQFVDLSPQDDKLVENFGLLHEFKNDIFFNYVTEKTLGLFE